ncbi:glycosyltransferase [Halorussus lipolyticus]|uniref:glycosyltransferase n=1 Tax=Halorussus lipolyticus TaxID=3034024 RepID=UPI0023E86D6D|nr:glycosyltransferase [Halorussus sp. DT80]
MNLCIAHGGDITEPSGGTDRITAFAGGLADRGHDVTLVVPEGEGERPDRLDSVRVEAIDTDGFGRGTGVGRALAVAWRAKQVADERDATIQFAHSTLAGFATLVGCEGYVLDMHDLAFARFDHVDSALSPVLERFVSWLERRGVRKASHVVTVSGYMKEFLADEWGVPEGAVTVLPNGFFEERRDTFAGTETIPGRVVFLGTLHPKVDVDALRETAQLPEVEELVVVGDGALREELDAAADELDSLRTTGRLPDAEAFDLVASASVVVNPQEPSALQQASSPVKLFYYAALGVPMVVTSGPDPAEEFASAGGAELVEPGESFADRVAEVLRDDDRRAEMAESAAAAAREMTWDARVGRLETIYWEA